MGRRSFYFIGILLFCIWLGACYKKDLEPNRQQEEATEEEYRNIPLTDKEVQQNEDIVSTDYMNRNGEKFEEGDSSVETNKQSILYLSDYITGETKVNAFQDKIRNYPAGTVVDITGLNKPFLDSLFYSEEIKVDVKDRINGKSYGDTCNVPYSELRYVRVLHKDFNGQTQIGELIVNQVIAEDIVNIFREFYVINYPIERMVLIDEYNADDVTSMEANNTSAFNYRTIADTNRLSLHSYGLAIDINPRYNPYIYSLEGRTVISPENGTKYADRTLDCSYYIKSGDPCYQAFINRGFTWGGDWKNSKDYQHFQMKRNE
jgi:hypothetical protein